MNFDFDFSGSDDEKNDLKAAYQRYKGNMDAIMESVPGAEIEDETRLSEILMEMIKNDEIPEYKIFTQEPQKKKDARKRRVKLLDRMRDSPRELLPNPQLKILLNPQILSNL